MKNMVSLCKREETLLIEINIGPIVRINPNELHVHDPDYFVDGISSFSAKLDRYEGATRMFGILESTLAIVPADLHKLRRGSLAPYFSRTKITRLQGLIQRRVEMLCFRIREFADTGGIINLGLAFRCLTIDVIAEYALSQSEDYLNTPDFSPLWFQALRDLGEVAHLVKHVPWLLPLMQNLPLWLVSISNPEMARSYKKSQVSSFQPPACPLISHWKSIERQVVALLEDGDETQKDGNSTIFRELFSSDLPPQEKSIESLSQEGVLGIWAGSEATGSAIKTPAFHFLNAPDKLVKLQRELSAPSQTHPRSHHGKILRGCLIW